MEFDLQTFLMDMKRELKEDNTRIEGKIDSCLMTVADHETRVSIMEATPPGDHEARLIKIEGVVKVSRWLVGTAIGAGIAGLVTWFISIFSGSPK